MMAREGLRTLVAGRRILTSSEYQEFEVSTLYIYIYVYIYIYIYIHIKNCWFSRIHI